MNYLINKKKNFNNEINVLYCSMSFTLKLGKNINRKTYLSFDIYISIIEIILNLFSIIYRIKYMCRKIPKLSLFILCIANFY